jgi:hypothetical protein
VDCASRHDLFHTVDDRHCLLTLDPPKFGLEPEKRAPLAGTMTAGLMLFPGVFHYSCSATKVRIGNPIKELLWLETWRLDRCCFQGVPYRSNTPQPEDVPAFASRNHHVYNILIHDNIIMPRSAVTRSSKAKLFYLLRWKGGSFRAIFLSQETRRAASTSFITPIAGIGRVRGACSITPAFFLSLSVRPTKRDGRSTNNTPKIVRSFVRPFVLEKVAFPTNAVFRNEYIYPRGCRMCSVACAWLAMHRLYSARSSTEGLLSLSCAAVSFAGHSCPCCSGVCDGEGATHTAGTGPRALVSAGGVSLL